MKFLDIVKGANHNLWRNKLRSFLTILAIFVGSFTIILNSAINAGVNDFIDKQTESIGGDGYLEIAPTAMYDQVESMMGGSTSISEYSPTKGSADTAYITEQDLNDIRNIDGVESVEPYHNASVEYITSERTTKKYNTMLNIIPDNSINVDMSAGRQVDANSSSYEAMIVEDYLQPLGFDSAEDALNQTITFGVKQSAKCYTVKNLEDCITTVNAKITGIQAPGVLSTTGSIRVNPALNNAIYNLSMEGVSDNIKNQVIFALAMVDPERIDEIKSQLEALGLSAITVADEAGMIRTFFDAILVVFNIFGTIALIAAAIGIVNTLFMSVQERTREIGLDKALGLSSSKIFLSFSIEAILLGLWGSVFGMLVSMGIGYGANAFLHSSGQILESFPTFELVQFSPQNIIPIVLLIMLIAFLAGTAPARQAAKKDPIDALRYE